MLEVVSRQEVDTSSSRVQVDEYVPLSFRSYDAPIGARYLRVGNFKTSLMEFVLDPNCPLLKGFTLTLFDTTHTPKVLGEVATTRGLPVLGFTPDAEFGGSPHAQRIDACMDFSFGLGQDFAEVVLSNDHVDELLLHGRVGFLLCAGRLVGVRVLGLTKSEMNTLAAFIAEAKERLVKAR